MPSLQQRIGYEGDIKTAPVESVGVEFDVPIHEYFAEDDAAGTEVIHRYVAATSTMRLLQPLASAVYQLTLPDSLVVPEDEAMRSLYGQHYMQARSHRRLDDISSTVVVKYYAQPGPLIGQATLDVLYIPDLEPFTDLEDDGTGTSVLLTTFVAVNKRAYDHLVAQLAASLIEIDDIVLLDVVSYLTDVTDGVPAPVKRPSAKVKPWIIARLDTSGVADAKRAYEIIKSELRQLFEFTLVIPEMKPVAIGGRFGLIPAGVDRVSETDFSFFHMSAEFSTMSGGPHISRHDFARPLHVEHDSVAFSLSNGPPVFQGAVTTPIVVNVKAFDGSVAWTQEYEAGDQELARLEIELPMRRPSVLDPRASGTDTDTAKKLRGQVLDIENKCPVKDLTVLVQARSDPAAIWRVVGAATSDGSGNFSMPYPFGVYTEAEALVSLTPDAPAPIPIVVGKEPNQTISDDFLYLVVRGADCLHVEDESDCDCHGPKKASRLPDYADLIGSDDYSQDIGGACVNLSSPNRTLSEFSYQAIVRTSDPDVANYTLRRSDDGSRYDLVGARQKRPRKPVDLDNPVAWQDAPEDQRSLSFYQAVTIATGHILHYRSLFKADGYSLGDLVYSLALAPGQKKEIVVFDSSHSLLGAESQALSQGERLALGLTNEREITSVLGGGISESLRGSSSANTSGISAGLGVGAIVGPVGAVLGVSGGVANSNSSATQNSSRDVSQAFGELLRQSIMQNAEGYRQLNASVVTTVQEGQRYGVTSEVVANHNHCHALTMMYFEVLRHYAIYQELSRVEECVFLPFLMTNFTRENIYRWMDVLAPSLLPMPSDTYLQPSGFSVGRGHQHPLVKAFDANERIKTGYANTDYPAGAYDDERIQFVKGSVFVRADLPRPRTRYDRIRSLPVTTKTVTSREIDPIATAKAAVHDSIAAGLTGGLSLLFTGPPGTNIQYNTTETQVLVKQAIFDAFMTMDANYESVPPAQCIRVTNFAPNSISFGPITVPVAGLDFFLDGIIDRALWTAYAKLLGYNDVLKMLDYYFKGRLIAEWDSIFYNDMAPIIFERIVASLKLTSITTDFTSSVKYKGGERLMRLNVNGSTNLKRNELPLQLELSSSSADAQALREFVTLTIDSINLSYSTSHFNGTLFSGSTNDDLLDGTTLFIPESAEEKRNPRTEDAYLVYKLIEHLNSNLEYYNKVLWYNLDPDRRYMLLDGFNIEVFDDDGLPAGRRSVASVVKNSLITITGNSLVFAVAPGYKVSQSYLVRQASDDPPEADAPVTRLSRPLPAADTDRTVPGQYPL